MTNQRTLAEMIAKAGDGRGGRSPVYAWLKGHHRDIRQAFDQTGPGLLKVMRQKGAKDRHGKPPTLKIAQQHWSLSRREMAALPPAKPPTPALMPKAKFPAATPLGIRSVAASMVSPANPPSPSATPPEGDPLADALASMNKQ